jgi:FkbM family methyltransferase
MSYKNRQVEPFVYQPCEIMPGQMAVPVTDFDNTEEVIKWYQSDGDRTLLVDYPLNQDSVVFDVGGYRGDWSQKIADLYDCHIYIFEPVPEFFLDSVLRFSGNPKVRVFPFGLSSETITLGIDRDSDSSSFHRLGHEKESVEVRDVVAFLEKNKVGKIDLMSINCEGAEFPLLFRMIESELITLIDNLQVQFHQDYPNAVELRDMIRHKLGKTHSESYNFPFVWESWKIKGEK